MAPKKRHQQSVNKHKPIPNGHKQEVTNTIIATRTQITTAYAGDLSLQQPSQPYVNTSTHYNNMTDIQPQASTHETFQFIAQPYTEEIHVSNTSGNTNGSTPMERWQNERAHEQPWHAIGGVSAHNEGNMDEHQQDINLDNPGYDGKGNVGYGTAWNTSGDV
ncbi:hypothetical protein N431DRAFT_449585 [Stipitochalara longipes BDJ]|nr:hypothetical protein N431DRAFT_449585 [Stipitochalara longipes BDJ]